MYRWNTDHIFLIWEMGDFNTDMSRALAFL